MRTRCVERVISTFILSIFGGALFAHTSASAADKLFTLYTARVMSQAYPWIAVEAGLFKKYDLEIPLVFVTPGAPAVAAILSGDSEVAVIGAASITRPFVAGNKEPIIIGGIKSLLTHSILAKPDIKRPEQLKGKRIGVSRIGDLNIWDRRKGIWSSPRLKNLARC
jgi:ABC-type nitrate/sulfonate/bicarbonate transport system substrate-binding protein